MSKANKRQRQRENRAERRAREEREARRRRTIRFATRAAVVLAVVIGAGVVLSFVGGDDEPADTTVAPTTSESPPTTDGATTTLPATTTTTDPAALSDEYLQFRELPVACGAEAPPPLTPMQFDAAEDQGLDPEATVTATVSTSCGDLVIEMDPAMAPETVNSFVFLARQDYFDGVVSHRLVPGFVVQAGDPTARGTGGPGYSVPDEFPDDEFAYDRGVVAMANVSGQEGSTGSQFFIPFGETNLNPPLKFNPVGRVVEGDDVLDRIEQILVAGERPLEALYIEDVTIDVQ